MVAVTEHINVRNPEEAFDDPPRDRDISALLRAISRMCERRKRRPHTGHEWGTLADAVYALAERAERNEHREPTESQEA